MISEPSMAAADPLHLSHNSASCKIHELGIRIWGKPFLLLAQIVPEVNKLYYCSHENVCGRSKVLLVCVMMGRNVNIQHWVDSKCYSVGIWNHLYFDHNQLGFIIFVSEYWTLESRGANCSLTWSPGGEHKITHLLNLGLDALWVVLFLFCALKIWNYYRPKW